MKCEKSCINLWLFNSYSQWWDDCYETLLQKQTIEEKVTKHLELMGFKTETLIKNETH